MFRQERHRLHSPLESNNVATRHVDLAQEWPNIEGLSLECLDPKIMVNSHLNYVIALLSRKLGNWYLSRFNHDKGKLICLYVPDYVLAKFMFSLYNDLGRKPTKLVVIRGN